MEPQLPRSAPPASPHAARPVLSAGPPPGRADGALLLLHGRGARAEGMLALFAELGLDSLAALAPQAADSSWYPNSFLAPIESNQPYLDSALGRIESLVAELVHRGTPRRGSRSSAFRKALA